MRGAEDVNHFNILISARPRQSYVELYSSDAQS